MSKRSLLKNPQKLIGKNVTLPFGYERINYNALHPAFSFKYIQDEYCISKWENKRIKRLIEELGKLEDFTWQEIETQKINHFKVV